MHINQDRVHLPRKDFRFSQLQKCVRGVLLINHIVFSRADALWMFYYGPLKCRELTFNHFTEGILTYEMQIVIRCEIGKIAPAVPGYFEKTIF